MSKRKSTDVKLTSYFQVLNEKRPCSEDQETRDLPPAVSDRDEDDNPDDRSDSSVSFSSASTSKHKQGRYDPEWEAQFPSVYPTDDGSGMDC